MRVPNFDASLSTGCIELKRTCQSVPRQLTGIHSVVLSQSLKLEAPMLSAVTTHPAQNWAHRTLVAFSSHVELSRSAGQGNTQLVLTGHLNSSRNKLIQQSTEN